MGAPMVIEWPKPTPLSAYGARLLLRQSLSAPTFPIWVYDSPWRWATLGGKSRASHSARAVPWMAWGRRAAISAAKSAARICSWSSGTIPVTNPSRNAVGAEKAFFAA